MKILIATVFGVGGIFLLALPVVGQGRQASPTHVERIDSAHTQEDEQRPTKPASSQTILSATQDLQKAVNGKASVRNRCRAQSKDLEIEETAEIVQSEKCKLVVKAVKTTKNAGDQKSPQAPSVVEFMIYSDLSDLTTPVLVETQKFAQCDAAAGEVVKVSSRADPKKPLEVLRRAPQDATGEGVKQTRRDLSLFFADPAAAKHAAKALDRAIKACGGKEWPDDDDLP
jgi:hypothetical protein